MTFGFEDIGIDDLITDGFPVADLDFDLAVEGQHATGLVTFDGSDTARVRTRVGSGPEEFFDLPFGALLPPAGP
ncbi:MAG: hypothetical protein HC813_00930 [Planctomycetes bacterium]|nr:hypothetical protein [Planctomycetota bacterium]